MEYKHINDCWEDLKNCESVDEIREKFENFPRWSGDWDLELDEIEGGVYVTNTYVDKDTGVEDERTEFFELDLSADLIEDCLNAIEEMLEESNYADRTREIHDAEAFKEEFSKCYKFAADEMMMDSFFWENYEEIYKVWKSRGLEDEWNNNAADLRGFESDYDRDAENYDDEDDEQYDDDAFNW